MGTSKSIHVRHVEDVEAACSSTNTDKCVSALHILLRK